MLANVPRLKTLMQKDGFDAVIATCAENVTYLSGFWAMSQWVRRGPQAYVLFTGEGHEPCIIVNSGLLDLVPDQEPWVSDIRRYGYFQIDTDKAAQLDAERYKLADFGLDGAELLGGEQIGAATVGVGIVGKLQQSADRFCREAQLPRRLDETQPPDRVLAIDPPLRRRPLRFGQQSDLFVEAYSWDLDVGPHRPVAATARRSRGRRTNCPCVRARANGLEKSLTACTYVTPSRPENPDAMTIAVGGSVVARDEAHKDGWDWLDRAYGKVGFFGTACEGLAVTSHVAATVDCHATEALAGSGAAK